MPRYANKLTAARVNAAKPKARAYSISDGLGLVLLVKPNGLKPWRFRYRFQGRPKTLTLGDASEVGLAEARDALRDARVLLRRGIDPSAHRQAERRAQAEADSFKLVAEEYLATLHDRDESTVTTARRRLELYIYPRLGRRPVAEITTPEVLAALRPIEGRRRYETAQRVRALVGRVMRHAVATGRVEHNVAGPNLRGALKRPVKREFSAITDPETFGGLLRAIEGYSGNVVTRLALQILALTFVRPGELRLAMWAEIDMPGATWIIPASRMKMKRDHVVPLATQTLTWLREAEQHRLDDYVFPSVRRGRPISDGTMNSALRALGYTGDVHVSHGFRASARTMINERFNFSDEVMERQLAHLIGDETERAYNRAALLDQRREMMQAWADYLDELIFVG